MKILVVEDSAAIRQMIGSFITAEGHEPLFTRSGEEALATLTADSDVGLILMDVEMPGLDGFETTRRLRQQLGEHWIPVIFLTGKADEASFAKGIEAGGDDYLTKPISAVILKAKIRAMERISAMRDQLRSLNEELRHLSQHDALTGCYNRRTFADSALRHWHTATRQRTPLSLIMLDIDHFKLYNDHFGHPGGDSCLQQVSSALATCLQRPEDLLARYGGEEFIILLPDTDLEGALHVGNSICSAIAALNLPHPKSPTAGHVSVSLGIATLNRTSGASLEGLIACADTHLYTAKARGRNQAIGGHFNPAKTILVADDDPETRQLLQDMLQDHCRVITADGGHTCLDVLEHTVPDLLLLALHMPGISGLDVCRQLRSQPHTATVPVFFMSATSRQEQVRLGREVGANACFEKPINPQQLITKVNHFLL